MRLIRHTETVPPELSGGVIAIGNFDGVHLGHQTVINQAKDIARDIRAPMVVVTFEPHPRIHFQPHSAPFRLTSLRVKAHLMEALGVDGLVVLHFDHALAAMEAEDFVANILARDLGAFHVVVGENFAFGRGRKGNVALLEHMAEECGFKVTPAVQVRDQGGAVISSNTIRGFLRNAEPEAAARLLGRPWEVDGRVVHGDGRGAGLGFPTANVRMDATLLPCPGVYAVCAGIDAGAETQWFDGAANFGTRPQFQDEDPRLEVFLMDYSGDLYGRTLRVSFVAYLRPEAAFDSVDALIQQMKCDVLEARARLQAAPWPRSEVDAALGIPFHAARVNRGDEVKAMSGDYKSTVFLPCTDFPMKAGLPAREPELLARWQRMGLWAKLRAQSAGRQPYILHDGPPYANGNIHMGHALNKILKDVINRTRQMQGFDANYVPGWDCHGLPIEWMIEEKYRGAGKDKGQVPVIDFREECRVFAARWIEVQSQEFKRLGIFGDWDNPYTTMAHEAEATIVAELGKYLLSGGLYKGVKPLMWSPVERTVLAEAEVDYEDHTSTTVWVRFPVEKTEIAEIEGACVVIWTTTPWTLPGNRAVAYGADIDYVVIEVTGVGEESGARVGERLVLAEALKAEVLEASAITGHEEHALTKGEALAGTVLAHPLGGQGYDFDVPLVEGHHVTTEQGTGFVHIAPGHGADDFVIGQRMGLEIPETVGPGGLYYDRVPLFGGTHVFKADQPVAEAIDGAGTRLAQGKLTHSYPHSWRSKAPLIYRATPQWFISMETGDLREHALAAIEATRWIPRQSRNRIQAVVADGPDWCVSRQRAWGVPITVFVHKETGEPLRDEAVMGRIVAAIAEEGCDVWFTADPARFLAPEFDPADFEKVTDILDVWFDSGATHAFVLEARDDLSSPADLYLEGTDQHRGWFRSSLLESCGTRNRAPYKAVLTHGFVNDEKGRKMSKSLGNTTAPQEVVDKFGADILRLWVVSSDYSEDLRIGADIISHSVDTYRRLRNTLRYVLGSLQEFEESERVEPADMPELERWILHRLFALDQVLRGATEDYDFHRFYTALHKFCALDLSAFYFDVRKDSLYCDPPSAPKRRAARTVLDRIFHCLTAWLAPVLCFTAEEAWLLRFPSDDDSVHLRRFPEIPAQWEDAALARRWEKVRDVRRVVTSALEVERAEKRIGSSLQARPVVHGPAEMLAAFEGIDAAELFITSGAELVPGAVPDGTFVLPDYPGIGVVAAPAGGGKCARCWKVLDEVGHAQPDDVCHRCADALRAMAV